MTRENTILAIRNVMKRNRKLGFEMSVCINGFVFNLRDYTFYFGNSMLTCRYIDYPVSNSLCYDEIVNIY